MVDRCPGCGDELDTPNQRYCGQCGQPLNVEVDRDTIRRQTSGVLDVDVRRRILDSIRDERGPHHEYTHVRIQEQVRHALFDFWLLYRWEDFDNREALLADLGRDDSHLSEDEKLTHLLTLLGTFQFLFRSVSVEVIAKMLFKKIADEVVDANDMTHDEFDELDTVSLQLTIDDDRMDEPFRYLSTAD